MLDTTLEWIGFISGVSCVWLMVKRHVATWPVGLVNSSSWLLLFWLSGLYLNSILQVVYIGLGLYGWACWRRPTDEGEPQPIRRISRPELVAAGVVFVTGTAVLAAIMERSDDPAPFWDAATTVVSVVATYLQAKKVYEAWFMWVTVDVVYLALYTSQDLYLTAATQVAFGTLCVLGLRDWHREMTTTAGAPA